MGYSVKAQQLQSHLQSLAGNWDYPDDTVDTFKEGDPQTEVQGIAVAWMSYNWALKRAVELGCNVFITHEPTYYNHFDNDPGILSLPGVRDKRQFLEDSGLVLIRCHDLWDQITGIGIPDSWGSALGLGEAIAGDEFSRVYDVGGVMAVEVARRVAERTKRFGQPSVQLIGPADKHVNRVSVGTGAITPYLKTVRRFDVDLAICTDDGIEYWRDGAFAIDMGIPLLVVNHPVSEEMGMESLARHLRSRFPQVPVHHIPQRCMYQLITSQEV